MEQDELALLQTLEEPEEGEQQQQQQQQGDGGGGAGQGQVEGEVGGEEGRGTAVARRSAAAARERKTRKDRNREARRRAAEEAAAAAAALKRQRRELDSLPELAAQVVEAEAEAEARRVRRAADRAERAAQQPPRLGKLPFEPMPLQVLTSSEVSGSLRRLRPTAVLAKDRFKSLQKRGAIEPRKRVAQKKTGKKVRGGNGWVVGGGGGTQGLRARRQLTSRHRAWLPAAVAACSWFLACRCHARLFLCQSPCMSCSLRRWSSPVASARTVPRSARWRSRSCERPRGRPRRRQL